MVNMYNTDCMSFMAGKPDKYYDLAIVDPPYGIGESGQKNKADRSTYKWINPKSQIYRGFEDKIPDKQYFDELFRVSKNQIIWGGNYFTRHLPPKSGWIVWNKKSNLNESMSMAELAWTSFDIRCLRFDFLWAGFRKAVQVKRIHPTQKPVQLYLFCLENFAKKTDKILDTHGGSGSICIAADSEGFNLDFCEKDTIHFDNARNRFNEYLKFKNSKNESQ